MWTPITAEQIELLLEESLRQCSPAQIEFFSRHRVPLYRVPVRRGAGTEQVFVVAHVPGGVVYYEDVEEGFEVSALDADGAVASPSFNQFELRHLLSQIAP